MERKGEKVLWERKEYKDKKKIKARMDRIFIIIN